MASEQEQTTPISFREALFNNQLEACESGSGKRYFRIDPPEDGVLTHEGLLPYLRNDPWPKDVFHGQPIYVISGLGEQARMYQIVREQRKARTFIHDSNRQGQSFGFIGERQDPSGWWLASDTIPDVQAVYLPEEHYQFCLVSKLNPALLERVNTDEAVALRETLRTYNEACPYLKEVLSCPVAKIQERLDRLTRLADKYRTYPQTKLRDLGMDKYHSYWLLEKDELDALKRYRENLAARKLLSLTPDEMEKACLEISLNRMENQEEGNELTLRQAFWLDELLVTLGQPRYSWVENPILILRKLEERASTHNLRPRDLDRERQLAEDLKNKLKAVDAPKRRYYDQYRKSHTIDFGNLKEAVIQEERERQAAEAKRAPESVQQPTSEPSQEADLQQVTNPELVAKLAEFDKQIENLRQFMAKGKLPEALVADQIRQIEEKKGRLRKRFEVAEV